MQHPALRPPRFPARRVTALALAAACLGPAVPSARAQSTCSVFETQVLLPGDLAQADRFGSAAAMDGGVLVLGAPFENGKFGAAYVFRWNGAGWSEEQKLAASDGAFLQEFGQTVAVDGNVAVIGSPGENCQEAAYVFRFDGSAWVEEQKLTPSAASFCNRYGWAVAVSGDVVVVGAERDDVPGGTSEAGSAFVYRFDGTQWNEEQKLVSSNIAVEDRFGHSAAVEGDRLLIGAPRRIRSGATTSGSVYAFRKTPGGWVEEQEIAASDAFPSNGFGEALALDGDTLAVAAMAHFVPGAAYVYTHDGTAWAGEQKVTASDGKLSNEFGASIALSGSRLAVGARDDAGQGTASGAAYLFERAGGAWSQSRKLLTTDGVNGNRFGGAAALEGDRLVVGSDRHDIVGSDSGAAFVYDLSALPACPASYCTGKTNSAGCVPTMGYTGSPSATVGTFRITAARVVNRKTGILVYGPTPDATPFMGGLLCVGAPIARTAPVNSFGNGPGFHDCTGTLSFPMNFWIKNGGDPSLVPGAAVHAQFWFRDPLDAFGIGLSDALAFVIEP